MRLTFGIMLPFHWFDENKARGPNFCKGGPLTEFKAWEIELNRGSPARILDFDLNLEGKGSDHAGFGIEIIILGLSIAARIIDIRHWNYKENRWFNIGEDEGWE